MAKSSKDKVNQGRMKAQATVKLYRYIIATQDHAARAKEYLAHLEGMYKELGISINFGRELASIDALMNML